MDGELSQEELKLIEKDDRATNRYLQWTQGALALVGGSALIVIVQAVNWLRTGAWPSLSLRDALAMTELHPNPIPWVGLQRIANFVWNLPVSGALFMLAIGVLLWITRGDNQPDSDALREARSKQARAMIRVD